MGDAQTLTVVAPPTAGFQNTSVLVDSRTTTFKIAVTLQESSSLPVALELQFSEPSIVEADNQIVKWAAGDSNVTYATLRLLGVPKNNKLVVSLQPVENVDIDPALAAVEVRLQIPVVGFVPNKGYYSRQNESARVYLQLEGSSAFPSLLSYETFLLNSSRIYPVDGYACDDSGELDGSHPPPLPLQTSVGVQELVN